jgi:hypothetical protein
MRKILLVAVVLLAVGCASGSAKVSPAQLANWCDEYNAPSQSDSDVAAKDHAVIADAPGPVKNDVAFLGDPSKTANATPAAVAKATDRLTRYVTVNCPSATLHTIAPIVPTP